ncbi:MAG TPA: hypothetical protein VE130_07030 [Nitrososphaeraceae archaeon]|nr:hypothetical protein [Nitrososphaeraceae archaeon]
MSIVIILFLVSLMCLMSQNHFLKPVLGGSTDFFAGRTINNKSLEMLAQEFWNWTMSVPADIPIDPTINKNECYLGSDTDDQVLFGVGVYAISYESECTIPGGKYFLVPLLVGECDSTVPDPRAASDKIEDKWACARDADEIFKAWEVVLDGHTLFKNSGGDAVNMELKDQILVRNSSLFTLEIPEGNQFDAPPGRYDAVVDGYYLVLNPLSPGKHSLSYKYVHEQGIIGVQRPQQIPGSAMYILNVE